MGGAIPLLPHICHHGVNRGELTFTFTFYVFTPYVEGRDLGGTLLRTRILKTNLRSYFVLLGALDHQHLHLPPRFRFPMCVCLLTQHSVSEVPYHRMNCVVG
jgi:hypothetical protein